MLVNRHTSLKLPSHADIYRVPDRARMSEKGEKTSSSTRSTVSGDKKSAIVSPEVVLQ